MYGEGNYALTAVKEVSVTQSFLGLSSEDKKCQNLESLEDCSTRSYLQSIRSDLTSRTILHFCLGKSDVDPSVWATREISRFVPRPSWSPSQRWRERPRTAGFPVREHLLMSRNILSRNISGPATGISWRNTRDTGTLTRLASSSSTISDVSQPYNNLISTSLFPFRWLQGLQYKTTICQDFFRYSGLW